MDNLKENDIDKLRTIDVSKIDPSKTKTDYAYYLFHNGEYSNCTEKEVTDLQFFATLLDNVVYDCVKDVISSYSLIEEDSIIDIEEIDSYGDCTKYYIPEIESCTDLDGFIFEKHYYYRDNKGSIIFVINETNNSKLSVALKEDKGIEFVPITNNEYYCNTCKTTFHAFHIQRGKKKEEEKEIIIKCLFCHAEIYHSKDLEKLIKDRHANKTEDSITAQLKLIDKGQQKKTVRRKTDNCVLCGKKLPHTTAWNKVYCSELCKGKARLSRDVAVKERLKQLEKLLGIDNESKSMIYREHDTLRQEEKEETKLLVYEMLKDYYSRNPWKTYPNAVILPKKLISELLLL